MLWLHDGQFDMMCESPEELAKSEVETRARRVSRKGIMVTLGNSLTLLHQGVPSTRVRVFTTFFDLFTLWAACSTRFHYGCRVWAALCVFSGY
jgi:hypothetical protein